MTNTRLCLFGPVALALLGTLGGVGTARAMLPGEMK